MTRRPNGTPPPSPRIGQAPAEVSSGARNAQCRNCGAPLEAVEVAAPKALGQSVVSSHLLQDTFSDHIHTVSVELLTPPQLLRLTDSTPLGSFLLR